MFSLTEGEAIQYILSNYVFYHAITFAQCHVVRNDQPLDTLHTP